MLFVLAQIDADIYWRLAGAVLLIFTGASAYLKVAKADTACSVIALGLEKEHGIILSRNDGLLLKGALEKSGLVTSFLIILNIRTNDFGKLSLVLLPDCMSRDAFRRLCVVLRLRRAN